MTQIDGLSLPVRLPIDGDAFDAACEYARTHDLTISAAASEMLRSFAPSVDAGTTPPGCPEDGREGSGEPPASLPSVLYPCEAIFCTEGRGCTKGPLWSFTDQNVLPWIGGACCDDHIPDGWVLPEVVSPAPTVDTIAAPMPHVHITDEPCGYGDRCGR